MIVWLLLLGALVIVPPALVRRQRRRTGAAVRYKYRPMRLLVGSAGTGKSYYLTFQAVKSLAEGRSVLVNFGLRPDRVYLAMRQYGLGHRPAMDAVGRIKELRSFDDWIEAKDCDVYIDEVQNFIPGADWHDIPTQVVVKFAEHRHFRLRVTMAAHRFLALHTYVREGLIAEVLVARAPNVLVRIWRGMRTVAIGPQKPVLHYMNVKDESDELVANVKKRKGGLARLSASESVPLDPVIASCYNHIGGVFASPMTEIQRAKGRHAGVSLVVREPEPLPESYAVDGLPALSIAEVADLSGLGGVQRAGVLHERFADVGVFHRTSHRGSHVAA